MDDLLFAENDLRMGLEATIRKLPEDLNHWSPDELLALPEADVVNHLVAAHSVECPRLRRDEAQLLPVAEEAQTVEDRSFGRVTRRLTRLTLLVPRAQASSWLDDAAVMCGWPRYRVGGGRGASRRAG